MKTTSRIIKSIKEDIQNRNFDSNPLCYAYYLHFLLLNHEQSAEQIDLLDWAKGFAKDVLTSGCKTKHIDDEIAASLLIRHDILQFKKKEIAKIKNIKKLIDEHTKEGLCFDSLYHTIIIKYSIDELEEYVQKDIIIKIIKDPKCLVFCQDLPDKTKKSIIFRINEEIQEDRLNLFDEFYYYWYLFRNKTLDKKNGFMLKINSYSEQLYLDEEDKLPPLAKALLYDIIKRLNDGFYIVSDTELEGKGLTRFGTIIFLLVSASYFFCIYLIYSNWSFIILEMEKINLWQKIIIGVPLSLGINLLFIVSIYSFFKDTILNSYPDKVVWSNLKRRLKKLYSALDFISWIKGHAS